MKKKVFALVLTVALAATAVIGGSLAYFTDKEVANNEFTVGKVDIELTEPAWTADGATDAPEVYAGESLAKDPTVENKGDNPCFVRIKVVGLDQFGDKGAITYRTNYQDGALGTDWVLHTDGYFYYSKVLAKDEKTSKLFEQIHMPEGLKGGEAATPVVVTAEAVQAQGARARWADVQNMSVADIAAWFGTCGEITAYTPATTTPAEDTTTPAEDTTAPAENN